jgi:hypothetical protein
LTVDTALGDDDYYICRKCGITSIVWVDPLRDSSHSYLYLALAGYHQVRVVKFDRTTTGGLLQTSAFRSTDIDAPSEPFSRLLFILLLQRSSIVSTWSLDKRTYLDWQLTVPFQV